MSEELKKSLHRAFSLGQTYWQQADSEYTSQHKKADGTRALFDQLVVDTVAALEARHTPDVQAAVDAALETMHQAVKAVRYNTYTSCADLYEDIVDLLEEYDGTNPLAEAEAKIAELEQANDELSRQILVETDRTKAAWIAESAMQAKLAQAEARVADAYSTGYEQGHNDTVEGAYSPELRLEDYMKENDNG